MRGFFLFSGGRAKVLQKARVNVIENIQCQAWYKSQGKKTKIQMTQICAGHEQGGIDACWVNIIYSTRSSEKNYNKKQLFHHLI